MAATAHGRENDMRDSAPLAPTSPKIPDLEGDVMHVVIRDPSADNFWF